MRVHSADALILRTYRYGEADRIVVFLTEDRGKKRGVAKNATKSRRRFGGGARAADARAGRPTSSAKRASWCGSIGSSRGRRRCARRSGRERTTPRTCWDMRRILPSCSTSGRPTTRRTSGCSGWARRSARRCASGGVGRRAGALLRVLAAAARRRVSGARSCARAAARPRSARARCSCWRERAYVCEDCAHGGPTLSPDAMAFLREAGRADAGGRRRPPARRRRRLREIEQAHRPADRAASREGTAIGARRAGN